MKIAELFVALGVKGGDSAGKALKGVREGLGEVKSMSLETKAAIVGVVYGLERLMSQSAQAGQGYTNFVALTGMSAKSLQQWQFAARQAGESGEELEGNLKAVQGTMTNMLLGKGAPEGMAMLANKVGFDPARARDTLYVMGQLQKFAQTVPQDIGNNVLKSFGLTEATIAAMRKNAFTETNFKRAPLYGDKEIQTLSKVDVAWKNLGQKIEMAFGHLTAKHGLGMVNEISKLSTEIFKLLDAFTKLAEKLKVFQVVGKVFEGWTKIFSAITGQVSDISKEKGGVGAGLAKTAKKDFENGLEVAKGAWISFMEMVTGEEAAPGGAHIVSDKGVVPNQHPVPSGSKNQNINVNQTLNFQHEGKDAKKTGQSVHKAVQDAYRQMSAQAQGS